MAESFFASLECELLNRRTFKTRSEARTALFTYIEGWYNPRRRHSGIEQKSPAAFEQKYRDCFEPRVTQRPALVGLLEEPERGPVDNPTQAFIDNGTAS
jgi:putative transposase